MLVPQDRQCALGNVLSAMPRSAHPGARKALAEIWNAEDRQHALDAVGAFEATYGAKFPKATAKITDDVQELLAVYDFPAEHWQHLRTTNPIWVLCWWGRAGRRVPVRCWPRSALTLNAIDTSRGCRGFELSGRPWERGPRVAGLKRACRTQPRSAATTGPALRPP
jgi:hypothetical protein